MPNRDFFSIDIGVDIIDCLAMRQMGNDLMAE
jgi:hypothetical protein